ncbi:MAG: IS30 family transposase [Syntrophomonadaceae bacterium]|nr:IS30 family transposase [Syntrophomonadaceae bacterium]
MSKNLHLTLSERIEIEKALRDGATFTEIGNRLGKDPSTISKEVRNHFIIKDGGSRFNPCSHRTTCKHNRDICSKCSYSWSKECAKCSTRCYRICKDFKEMFCVKHKRPPYVCNGCPSRVTCYLRKHIYEAKFAQKEYETTLIESRQGFAISPEELCRIDAIVSPLIQQGQSVHHICTNNTDAIMLDEKTVYNYIDAGLLSVGNLDLPRKVRYRIRKKKKPVRVDKQCHHGRTYEDYLKYMDANPDTAVVQMDSVEGKKGGKVLLTIFLSNCAIMIAFIREHNTARSVTQIFNSLDTILGRDAFCELFPIILTDRGSEFTDPASIEFDADGNRRTHKFYCDLQRSDQKGGCEVTHEMIRRVLPKGTPFDHLTQDDIDCMMSHINSYTRKKLNNRSAHQLFSTIHSEEILVKLHMKLIPANEINLTPAILKQK